MLLHFNPKDSLSFINEQAYHYDLTDSHFERTQHLRFMDKSTQQTDTKISQQSQNKQNRRHDNQKYAHDNKHEKFSYLKESMSQHSSQIRPQSTESGAVNIMNLLKKKTSRNITEKSTGISSNMNETASHSSNLIRDLKTAKFTKDNTDFQNTRKISYQEQDRGALSILDIDGSLSSSSQTNDTSQVRVQNASSLGKDSFIINYPIVNNNLAAVKNHQNQHKILFQNSKVIRDVSNSNENSCFNLRNKQALVKNQAPTKPKGTKMPLKDITKMILNNLNNSKNKQIPSQSKTFDVDSCMKPDKFKQNHLKTNDSIFNAPYGNPCVPQVRVQPKQLSESHNNSPRISSVTGSDHHKKLFGRIDRENDINFYEDILTQQNLTTTTTINDYSTQHQGQASKSFFLQPKVQRHAIQRQLIVQQQCQEPMILLNTTNINNLSNLSQGENVQSIECKEAHPGEARMANARLIHRQSQFKEIAQNISCNMKNRGKSHNSPRDSHSLDRMIQNMKAQQKLKKFNTDKEKNEETLFWKNNDAIIISMLEQEKQQCKGNNSLEGHEISQACRTRMIDWLIECCFSFNCDDRTWFLAQTIFDRFLTETKDQNVFKDSDVHRIGVISLYMASKYQDIIPLNSLTAYEKIAHKQISQSDILKGETELLRALDFQLELITPYDFHMYILGSLKNQFKDTLNSEFFDKLHELSLYLLRMSLQSLEFSKMLPSQLATSAIYSAITLLRRSPIHSNLISESESKQVLRASLMTSRYSYRIEKVQEVAKYLIQFYKEFDQIHCGGNQLKRFKPLSFTLK